MQRFTPMLAYADASAAIEFLVKAFGFAVRFRMDMPDGSVGHAELGWRQRRQQRPRRRLTARRLRRDSSGMRT